MYTKYKVCLNSVHKVFVLICLYKCPCVCVFFVCVSECVSWNVQPPPLNRKGVQLIATPPFPLVQNGGQIRGTITQSKSDPVLEPFHKYSDLI